MPCDWNLGIIYPIYKKGDMLDCNNYRGITVLNTAYKIFSLILQDRLVPHVEKIVGNYQRGFQNRKKATGQIFTWVKLYDAVCFCEIPAKLIWLVRMIMTNDTYQVHVYGKLLSSGGSSESDLLDSNSVFEINSGADSDEPILEPIVELIPEPISELILQPIPEMTPEPIPELIPEPIPGSAPESISRSESAPKS